MFPMALIAQEVSPEPEIEIPEAVREAYRLWRPTPLYRARRLERALDTPAHIYYKYEGVSPAGSHKPNTAVAAGLRERARRHQEAGHRDRRRPVGLVAGVRVPAVRARVRGLDGRLQLRPEALPALDDGDVGRDRAPLAVRAHRGRARAGASTPTGSLGIAISEAVEVAAQTPDTQLLARLGAQPRAAAPDGDRPGGDRADGAGRRVAGRGDRLRRRRLELRRARVPVHARRRSRGEAKTRFVAAEPAACPTLTRGVYAYDFGDTVGLTPLMPMYTLGHDFVPPPVHAGGLRYHGDSPLVCGLVKAGVVEARAYKQNETFEAAVQFARTEGIIPAPEPAHAIRAVIDEALARARRARSA